MFQEPIELGNLGVVSMSSLDRDKIAKIALPTIVREELTDGSGKEIANVAIYMLYLLQSRVQVILNLDCRVFMTRLPARNLD